MAKKLKTPKKKWLRKWVKQFDKEMEEAEIKKLKNTFLVSHTKMTRDKIAREECMDFMVKALIGLVLIGFAAVIVIEVVAATS